MTDIIVDILRPLVRLTRLGNSYIGYKTAERQIDRELKLTRVAELDFIREKIETRLGYVDVYDLISRQIKVIEKELERES